MQRPSCIKQTNTVCCSMHESVNKKASSTLVSASSPLHRLDIAMQNENRANSGLQKRRLEDHNRRKMREIKDLTPQGRRHCELQDKSHLAVASCACCGTPATCFAGASLPPTAGKITEPYVSTMWASSSCATHPHSRPKNLFQLFWYSRLRGFMYKLHVEASIT